MEKLIVHMADSIGMDWYQNNQTTYCTWCDGDDVIKGFDI